MLWNKKMLSFKHKFTGFTLVEVVISLALGGLIMTSIMALFVSFVQIWENKETNYDRFMDQVEGCVRFLSNELKTISGFPNGKTIENSSWRLMRVNSSDYLQNEHIVLGCKRVNAFCPCNNDIKGMKFVVLMHIGEQLILCHEMPEVISKRMSEGVELAENVKINRWLLSNCLKKWEFGHFDLEKGMWEFTSSLEQYIQKFSNKREMDCFPNGLLLTFSYEDSEEKRFIPLMNVIDSSILKYNCIKRAEQNDRKDET